MTEDTGMSDDTRMTGDTDNPFREEETDEPGMLGPLRLIGFIYQQGLGLDFSPEPAPERVTTRHRSGPLAAGEGGLSARRLADPLARLHYAAVAAEVALFPLCLAASDAERTRLNREIGQVLALDRAVAARLIRGWVVCWPRGDYPKTPRSLRLLSSSGRGGRERALGEMGPGLRQFIDAMKQTDGTG